MGNLGRLVSKWIMTSDAPVIQKLIKLFCQQPTIVKLHTKYSTLNLSANDYFLCRGDFRVHSLEKYLAIHVLSPVRIRID